MQHRTSGLGEPQEIVDFRIQDVQTIDHGLDDLAFLRHGGQPGPEHLERAAHARERIAHFMRDDRRELPELEQRGLGRELRLRLLPLA